MVATTPKYSLRVAEPGDASDMPTYTGAAMAAIESALDKVAAQAAATAQSQATSAGNSAVTAARSTSVQKTGDAMSGALFIQNQLVVQNTAGSANRFIVDANGTHLESLVTAATGAIPPSGSVDLNTGTHAVLRANNGQLIRMDRATFALWFNMNSSTRRIKRNIQPATPRGVLDIETVTYQYKPEVCDDGGTTHLGVIAEQVADVFPAAVVRDGEGNPEGVNAIALIAGLIQVVKDQAARIDALEAR